MHSVSARFASAVMGPHKPAFRAVLVDSVPQFGLNPTGVSLPIINGNVTIASLTDIKSTLTLTVPGEYWTDIQPYGAEIFVQRGIEFAPGDVEYVAVGGYHRVEQVIQENAPFGPVTITALDRLAQIQQNKLVFPLPLNNGDSHRDVFERLINGIPIPQQQTYPGLPAGGYGTYLNGRIPITWTGYNPDTTLIIGDQIVEDDSYKFLADLIKYYYATMRFTTDGRLLVYTTKVDASYAAFTLTGGSGGTVINAQRVSKRTDVHNIVTAYGSDPSSITDFIVTFNADSASPLAYNKTTYPQFGPSPTYYSSPLLQTDADVEVAGEVLLRRYLALPLTFTLQTICNPAIEPNDPIDVIMRPGVAPFRCIVDSIVVPLKANVLGRVITRIPTATEGLGLGLGIL